LLLVAVLAIAKARAAMPLPYCSGIEGRCGQGESWCRSYYEWGCWLTAIMY